MKRKVLSMLICTAMTVSQVSAVPVFASSSANETKDNVTTNIVAKVDNDTTWRNSSETKNLIKSISPDMVVDSDYSGKDGTIVNNIPTYKSVKAALSSVDNANSEEKVIFLKNGIYKEKLTIDAPNVTLVGESSEHTVITYDDASGTQRRDEDKQEGKPNYGTSGSASVTVNSTANNFKAVNLTITNSFDESKCDFKDTQAVALKNESDESVLYNCKLLGNQDTLYANNGRQYYKNCFIEGDVDFIFGAAKAVFKDCELKSVDRDGITPKGYVAAPSTLQGQAGYLMKDCKLTSNIKDKGSVYLGRAWHPSSELKAGHTIISNVVYNHCYLGAHIASNGWAAMKSDKEYQASENAMYEYNNYGPGADLSNKNRRQLSADDAENKYGEGTILSGWNDYDEIAQKISAYKENSDDYYSSEDYASYIDDDSDCIDTDESIYTKDSNKVSGSDITNVSKYNLAEQVNWNFTRFGVTTSEKNNLVTEGKDENGNKTITLVSGTADGANTGGKVTGSNDGLSYYYTEIDPSKNFDISAKVKVNYFEKDKPDKQCAFGIMARDQLGVDKDVSTAPSNMVLVGGYKANIESVYRSGVTADLDNKITMNGEHKFSDRPKNDGTSEYTLRLKKTNTGYICSVDDGKEVTYYEPKLLEVTDSNKIYLGFFTARVASITVSNINLSESDVATDPAGKKAPVETIKPDLSLKSSTQTGDTDYNFNIKPTVKGKMNVSLNGNSVYGGNCDSEKGLSVKTTLKSGENKFHVEYVPDATENNTDTAMIKKDYTVNVKSYGVENGAVYVSPEGTSDSRGTEDDPVDIYTAANYTGKGQTIKVKGGTYNLSNPITIADTNNGTAENMKSLESYDGRAIFDFGKKSKGFFLNGDYWNVSGIDVTNTMDATAGLRVAGNHNVLKNIKTYKNGDTGFQISSLSADDPKDIWPCYNTVINCDSYDNMDAAMNNADGFAAKITVGEGNVFKGCISHNNCDDGWDLFTKLEDGKIGAVTIEDCITYGNGTLSDGTPTKGDGNGFKLGGEGVAVKNKLINSLSFNNDAAGITGNSNPAIIVQNSVSANNDINYSLDYYTNVKLDYEFENDKSYQEKSGAKKDLVNDKVKSMTNYFYNGTDSENVDSEKLSTNIFKSVKMPTTVERDENNDIIWPDFMKLV